MIRRIFLIILAILPVILLCGYTYQEDRHKEPKKLLGILFVLGILSCILSVIFSQVLSIFLPFINKEIVDMSFLEIFCYSFFVVSFVEECCKWIMIYTIGYHSKAFDEVYDMIVYSVFVALGFALLENVFYITYYNSIAIGITRGLLAVPGHACTAVFMGYYFSRTKVEKGKGNLLKSRKYAICSLFVPTILHGIYDFCIFSDHMFFTILFLFFIFILYNVTIGVLKGSAESKEMIIKKE